MEMPPNATRGYLWMRTLANPILWGMNALLALLLWGDVIGKIFPDTEDYFRYLALLTALPWQWKVILTLLVNIVFFMEVSLRAVREGERQRDEYRRKLQQIEQARPHIVPRQPDPEYIEPVHIQTIGNVTNVVSFIKVRFVNLPTGLPFPNSVAHDVRAKVRFFEPVPGGRLLLAIEGIWDGSDQQGIRHWQQHRNDLLKMEFGIEEEHSLDIAFRDDETGELYAFNSDNYGYPQMKKPEHLLAGQHFFVRISLLGPWVDEAFEFLIANDSLGTTVADSLSLARPFGRQA